MESFEGTPSLKEKYRNQADLDGYVLVSAFAFPECRRQSKSIAALLDGEEGTLPELNLGESLSYKGSSGNYSDMKIHLDDIETFVARVRAHYGD